MSISKKRPFCGAKWFCVLLAIVLIGIAGILLYRGQKAPMPEIPASDEAARSAYLLSCGWQGELIGEQTVRVPSGADAVYTAYAALQEAQGLPLAEYAGEAAQAYTYRLREAPLYAELLVADGRLIGAQCYDPQAPVTLDMHGKEQ